MLDLHRHGQFSSFDGFDSADNLAKLAKEKGYTALGLSDHGTTTGLVQHYFACKENDIKPVLGVECYFKPVFNLEKAKEKKDRKTYHLCLFAKNRKGYENINNILHEANRDNFYYKANVTYKLLEKYKEGIICTSACIQSFPSQALVNNNIDMAKKSLLKYKEIFGDDFYIEVQPYKIDDQFTQETINKQLIKLGNELNIKCILTSDSHYGNKDDFDTYEIMHEIAGHTFYDIKETYKERYMPDFDDMYNRFIKMHSDINNCKKIAKKMYENLNELEGKVEDIFEGIETEIPKVSDNIDSKKELKRLAYDGLKKKDRKKKSYKERIDYELSVIYELGFEDYFLMVYDYVKFAKDNNIIVGPGRGSACNSLLCFALDITNVDSIYFDLDFNRFLRPGKKKLPDIDLDFETNRRDEVINYIIEKYKGRSAQIASYGLYKGKNLLNDLVKVCFVPKSEQAGLKNIILKNFVEDDTLLDYDYVIDKNPQLEQTVRHYNIEYDNIVKHFYKLFGKVRYIGTHAAGVAISKNNLHQYSSTYITKEGRLACMYDLVDIEKIGVLKFDILGLKTLTENNDVMRDTVKQFNVYEHLEDKKIIDSFREGKTDGIFQYMEPSCKDILSNIKTDCFNDINATNAMNRPAPIKLGMPQIYADHKESQEDLKSKVYWKYVKDTYGCIIYQEQVLAIAINIGGFTPDEADILVKMEHGASSRTKKELDDKYFDDFKDKFIENAVKNGVNKSDALNLFLSCSQYGFNKGHSTAYSLIALEQMYYKVYYPAHFWYSKLKYARKYKKYNRTIDEVLDFSTLAVKDNIIIFPPHVNFSDTRTKLRKVDGELIIQLGLITIDGIGETAAQFIENERKNGIFRTEDEFIQRCLGRKVNKGILEKLKKDGAINFTKKAYDKRTIDFNAMLKRRSKKFG